MRSFKISALHHSSTLKKLVSKMLKTKDTLTYQRRQSLLAFALGMLCLFTFSQSQAQTNTTEQAATPKIIESTADIVDITRLNLENTMVDLWGVRAAPNAPALFQIQAIKALEKLIDAKPLECDIISRETQPLLAQCANYQGMDLGIYLIQNGYAVSNRQVIASSRYAQAYAEAEQTALNNHDGIWGMGTDNHSHNNTSGFLQGSALLNLTFIFFGILMIAFISLAIFIMQGFKKIIDAQNSNMDMINKERALKGRESEFVAVMLASEIQSNKSKIEAYLSIYEEMAHSLEDPHATPKYQRGGDMVQMQPALDRNIFDKNSDKLESLGEEISSKLVHFYARIKSNPDIKTLDPTDPIATVKDILQQSLSQAQRMHKMAESLLQAFDKKGFARPE